MNPPLARRLARCRWRSALFAPANNPALTAKLPRSGPDLVIVDLEDAVPTGEKVRARALVVDVIATLTAPADAPLVCVRVNAVRTAWFTDDVAAVVLAGVDAIVVPKVERVDDIDAVRTAVAAVGAPLPPLVVGLETALGVADARLLVRGEGVVACYFGAEDFITDMGGVRTSTNAEIAVARAQIALAARLGGVRSLDVVTADFGDADRFRREAAEARAMGYAGKLCIHPSQVAAANESFVPTVDEVDRARRVLTAWSEATARGIGAISFEGQLIDEPMVSRARAVIECSSADGAGETGRTK